MNEKDNSHFDNSQHIHFVGIGGSGMCGIAEVLLKLGYTISGSDLNDTHVTQRLQQLGATVKTGHQANHIAQADVIVQSTAIAQDNPEIVAAHKQKTPVISRGEMLAELMRSRYGIAVAGTHGKTTTSSLMTSILSEANLDPSFIIGGFLNRTACNAGLGSSQYLVAEADESDASFLYLNPKIAVVTNIDVDHMATYADDVSQLNQSFIKFIHRLPTDGLAIVGVDDPRLNKLLPEFSRPMMTYGFSAGADIQAYDYQQQGTTCHFQVKRVGHSQPLDITLNLPGKHNAENALAAIAVATKLNIPEQAICQALRCFSGVGRRFQVYGELNTPNGTTLLVDDYGHHPRELESTIATVRAAWPKRRLLMVFQPHRYSRTQALLKEFATVLASVDCLLLLPVYAASEASIQGADSAALCKQIHQSSTMKPLLIKDEKQLFSHLASVIQEDDVIITQGAGSIGDMAEQLALQWKAN